MMMAMTMMTMVAMVMKVGARMKMWMNDADDVFFYGWISRGVTGRSEEVTSTPPAHESITSLPVAIAHRARVGPRAQVAGEPHECERADRGQERLP